MESRYEIYISGEDGNYTAVVRDNERLARYMQNEDLDYTWTRYPKDAAGIEKLKQQYKDCTIYYN